jgi:hypothetical protein
MPRSAEKKAQMAAGKSTATSNDDASAWMNVDDGIAKLAGGAHGAWKKALELAEQKRIEFEEAFVAEAKKRGTVDEGRTLRFIYRFGGRSFAFHHNVESLAVQNVKDEGRPRGSSRSSFSM